MAASGTPTHHLDCKEDFSNANEGKASTAKTSSEVQIEDATHDQEGNLVYSDPDVEPEIHWRTWVAFFAVTLLNFTYSQTTAGVPVALSFIAADVNLTADAAWIANAPSIANAVLSPIFSVASDTFQARKGIMVGACLTAFVGSAIGAGANSLWRLVFSQTLQGVGVAIVSVVYTVPAEILPRRWRPMAQASLLGGSAISCMVAPLSLGGLIKHQPHGGWRNYFWIQTALWGLSTVTLFVGYRPPKRHTRYQNYSLWQKVLTLDLTGFFLFTAGLTLLLASISVGAGSFAWSSANFLAPFLASIAVLAALGVWEWKGTSTGMFHHDIFSSVNLSGRRFILSALLIAFEGLLLFSIVVFVPMLSAVFSSDPFIITARIVPFYFCASVSAFIYGYIGTKFRTVRWPLMFGFLMYAAGIGALISVRPNNSTNALIFSGLAGLGLGAPLALLFVSVQLAVPHHVLATATALVASARAIGISISTAVFTVVLSKVTASKVAAWVPDAAVAAGVPAAELSAFVTAIASSDPDVSNIPGVTATMIQAGVMAMKNATCDALHVVFAIALPFGLISVPIAYFLGSYKDSMNYIVEAPMEELHAKRGQGKLAED
ncbi:uncharacterized protein A1O9_00720 [Exophiala aquamarina CBS 119918]|uniref:Major facilitator superfamily (MFS) profile domain-containing protein n=1 Tax=Exophiala aquamarina CBS 119918 TaxID=1182545 RepID=A0A072PSM5_9EURO|nr:uncharacterized protein A1O9_00720 [Exophiala aquamarina CBS 119918]KEF62747.1 hypothetical protein A1O9_00720 [Exophiala aquamarina CBS 119918]